MKHTKYMTASALAIASVTAFAGSASAVTVEVTSITPQWSNVVADPAGGTISVDNTEPDISLRWGTESSTSDDPADPQSGYNFTARDDLPFDVDNDVFFRLGDFNHLNFPVFEPVLDSVDLSVDFEILFEGTSRTLTSVFSLNHDETPNACAGVNCSDDFVAITNNSGNESFTIGGTDFIFNVLGFIPEDQDVDFANITNNFRTVEDQQNRAGLYGVFTASQDVSTIPLPAAGWMLLAGIGGLAAMRRRKKA